jgi:hypothetical protein
MEVIKLISLLRENDVYKKWKDSNKDAELVHIFLMIEPGSDTKFDIGFFDKGKGLMTSFIVDKDMNEVEISETKDVLAKDPQKILPIDEPKVKVRFDEALETAGELQKTSYAKHQPMKEVVILQNLEQGQVWNITFITKQFETLNIKVDAETGDVIEDKLHQIFSME